MRDASTWHNQFKVRYLKKINIFVITKIYESFEKKKQN